MPPLSFYFQPTIFYCNSTKPLHLYFPTFKTMTWIYPYTFKTPTFKFPYSMSVCPLVNRKGHHAIDDTCSYNSALMLTLEYTQSYKMLLYGLFQKNLEYNRSYKKLLSLDSVELSRNRPTSRRNGTWKIDKEAWGNNSDINKIKYGCQSKPLYYIYYLICTDLIFF